jgi:hypothetical protein
MTFGHNRWVFDKSVDSKANKQRIDELDFSSPYKYAPAELHPNTIALVKTWLETDEREPLDKDLKKLLAQNFVYAIPARKACS